ncbi:MAG TPA: hybrid sensor histidine kinase/response regulator [Chloroflexota bacterium]|nr:hybrid sensor histidine kinase/response regulator [Chloroflexota bacterium]
MMAERATSLSGDDLWLDGGLADMRRQALQEIAIALLLASLAAIPFLPVIFGLVSGRSVGVVIGLLILAPVVYQASNRWPRLAALLLIGGGLVILGLGITFVPEAAILPWFAVVVLLAGFLIGPAAGAGLAVLGTVVLVTGEPLNRLGLPSGLRLSSSLLLWAAAGLSWLALRPLLIALRWSWQNYLEVRQVNELLKERQGELNRTVKSLNEALDRLDELTRELDRARRAANQARQLKSEFAANVSHELRTPLNLIIGFSEMMVTSPQSYGGQALPPAYREDAIAIYRNARHLSDLVDDILDLSQIEAGHMGLHRELIPLDATIAEAIETVQVLYTQRGLSLTYDVPPDLPPIFADRTRLRQIIINLLSNAARFIDQGGAHVAARLEEREFVISVSDTGVGIPPDDLPHVFDEFWQGRGPRRAGGSGVGLAVSKRFVEMHGGSIWVTSTPGQGSIFTFTIPRSTNIPEMLPPRPWETWARLTGTAPARPGVAVVSDDRDLVHVLERHLDEYTLLPCEDIAALSAYPRRADLDGVLILAPDGLTALRRGLVAQTAVPGVPIIACGLVNTKQSLAERLGVADHLVKPISREQVAHILGRLGRTVRHVLVVDDDPDAVRLLARMIRSTSRRYRVSTALGGTQALRQIEEDPPDAIFLDLIMPEIDGYTLIETIRNRADLERLQIVAVSAQTLSRRPLTSDGVVFLRSDGLGLDCLLECVRQGLRILPRSEEVVAEVSTAESRLLPGR